MLKRIAILFGIVLTIGLQGCFSFGTGLQSYTDSYAGYEFLYPTGWVEVDVSGAANVVFHDIIHETENVSVVTSPVPEGRTLADLGSPTDVGYKLSKSINALAEGDRDVTLVNAQKIDSGDKTYYILEYVADLPTGKRHNLASAIVRRGKLFTFNASTSENRWDKVEDLLKQSVGSFKVY
ncbi:photosystem II reaction center PsbP [Halomicronema hongdechloris]|nr:photosystem II reaction center PsbP [Halomicronema hongdechloris]